MSSRREPAPGAPRADPVFVGWKVVDGLIRVRGWTLRVPERARRYLPVVPALVVVATLVWGLGVLAWQSAHELDSFTLTQGPFSVGNYSAIVTDPYSRSAFIRSLSIGTLSGVVVTLVSIPLAYLLVRTRSTTARIALLTVIFVPLLTGDVVRGYGWLSILSQNGVVSLLTVPLGLGRPNILGTGWAVAVGIVQTGIPFGVLSIVPSVHQLDPSLEQAASTLGARPAQVWRRVVLPSIRPGVVTAFALTGALSIGDFANPAILGQGRFDFAANAVQSAVLGRNNTNAGAALGITLLVIEMAVLGLVLSLGRSGGRTRPVAQMRKLP